MSDDARTALFNASDGAFRVEFERVDFDTGETFFVPKYAIDRPASKKVLKKSFYEPKTHRMVSALLAARPGEMVHAGAFFGDMLPTFARASAFRVFAFEPVLENYVLAKLCIEENGIDNVVLLNAALGSAVGTTKMDTGRAGGAHLGGASHVGGTGQRTAVLTIDHLGLSNVSVIQLDVEGYELQALRGAAQTIERLSPTVMIEDNSGNCAEYLGQLDYVACGQIPGLSIWTRPQFQSEVEAAMAAL